MSTKSDQTAVLPTSRAWADYVTLIKPRVNLLVLVTTVIGFHLGNLGGTDLPLLFNTVVGTFLVASGAAAFNQVLERDVDARMRRTMQRPLPDGRIGSAEAFWFATALSAIGLAQLWFGANPLAALVAVATLVSYALIYTPLKKVTSLATVVGAVPGALPPVIGWAAARDTLSIEAWVLFAIVFFWQMPHVLAISWLYRDDYERGGIRVLPVEEPDGRSTALADGELRRGARAGQPAADRRSGWRGASISPAPSCSASPPWRWPSALRSSARLNAPASCSSPRSSICRCSGC